MAKKSRRNRSTASRSAGSTAGGRAAAKGTKTKQSGKGAWKLMDRGSGLVAGLLAQRVARLVWRTTTGKKPPTSGSHPEVSAVEAVAWAAIGGGMVELVKVVVRRWTAVYWVRSTGTLPPGMKSLDAGRLGATKSAANGQEPVLAEPAPEHSPTGRASKKHGSTRKVSRRSRGR